MDLKVKLTYCKMLQGLITLNKLQAVSGLRPMQFFVLALETFYFSLFWLLWWLASKLRRILVMACIMGAGWWKLSVGAFWLSLCFFYRTRSSAFMVRMFSNVIFVCILKWIRFSCLARMLSFLLLIKSSNLIKIEIL